MHLSDELAILRATIRELTERVEKLEAAKPATTTRAPKKVTKAAD